MNKVKETRYKLIEYFNRNSFKKYRESIVTEYFKDKFNPSVGHSTLYTQLYPNAVNEKVFFSDLCIRDIDAPKVGYSTGYMTSFLMHTLFNIVEDKNMTNVYVELWDLFFHILDEFNVEKSNLYFSINRVDVQFSIIGADDLSYKILTERHKIKDNYIIAIPNNIISAQIGELTGPIVEIFFKKNNRFIEFATLLRGEYIIGSGKHNEKSVVHSEFPLLAMAIGVERFTMLLNDLDDIYDLPENKRFIDIIRYNTTSYIADYLRSESVSDFFRRELVILADYMKTVILMLNEGVRPSSSGLGRRMKKILKKVQDIQRRYKLVNSDIIEEFTCLLENVYNVQIKIKSTEIQKLINGI